MNLFCKISLYSIMKMINKIDELDEYETMDYSQYIDDLLFNKWVL